MCVEPQPALTLQEHDPLVSELSGRPGHEKVRVLLYQLLVDGLGADSANIDFEKAVPEVHGRIDALLGRTVFELKSDLRRERRDAEEGLTRYLSEREGRTGEKYVGIATDGADFIAFFLHQGLVVEVGSHHTEPTKPRELLEWLQCTVAVGEGLLPDPQTITREFDRKSLAARRALDDLNALWEQAGQTPGGRLKYELWSRLLSLAYGTEVGDDTLFLQHTYLVVVAKAVVWEAMVERPPPDAAALLHGTAFSELGIAGQSEPDFFDWVLTTDGEAALVMRIARQVNRFQLSDIRIDILKALYESLIDPETRHNLGKYYTPDWLAARMVAAAVDRPLQQRVMDPACGSGRFLLHAVRTVLDAADASGLPPKEAVLRAAEKIAGIDIHPVAVIFARVTYLLALMPPLREGHPGSVALPVYLGDALQWNVSWLDNEGLQMSMLEDAGALKISVPAVKGLKPKPKLLDAAMLSFPAAVASDSGLFDRVLNVMIKFALRPRPASDFSAWMKREVPVSQGAQESLRKTYEVMCRLQNQGRNHIWGYVARNLARPVWLSSEAQKADVVLGNPPWVAFRYMGGAFQERFRRKCRAAQLWVGGKVATQQDLSSYFYVRAALLYMRSSGRIALVMPYAALSRQAYAKFRNGGVERAGHLRFRLRFTDTWSFGPEVWPLFPVPSCVLFANRHDKVTSAPLPTRVRAFAGILSKRDADEAEASKKLLESEAPWPAEASGESGSPYHRVFRNGATLWPRRLVLVESEPPPGMLPVNPAFPLVRGRTSRQDKKPWKFLEPPRGTVGKKLLRPALLGESVVPFRVMSPLKAVIPWDEEGRRLMDSDGASGRGYRRLAEWLERTEALWEKHRGSTLSSLGQCEYYGKLSHQFPLAPIRVVYTKAGTNLAAAVVTDETAVVDHKLYWAAVKSFEEARYLRGILNSDTLRRGVEGYQSQGQWGARDFDKYVFKLPIPRFDQGNRLHCR